MSQARKKGAGQPKREGTGPDPGPPASATSPSRRDKDEANRLFVENLRQAAGELGIIPPAAREPEPLATRRARRYRPISDRLRVMRVAEYDGVLVLEEGIRPRRAGLRQQRRRRTTGLGGQVLHELEYERLGRSDVGRALEAMDDRLTPHRGLRQWKNGQLLPAPKVDRTGPLLLLVHGTFSNSESLIAGLEKTEYGRAFLKHLARHYQQILTYDHATLSTSAVLNARLLERELRGCPATIDVICHSRGGLVTRWWLEGFDHGDPTARRVVFLGSPLYGTSLASPVRLRAALSFLANITRVLNTGTGMVGATVPLLHLVAGLFRVITSITSFTARTPVIDAAVALVPGLQSMARVANNPELQSLHGWQGDPRGRYFVIQSDFEPKGVGWRFWRYFHGLAGRLADLGCDRLFDGPNDLVVDTASMTDFGTKLAFPKVQTCDFRTSDKVHHLNYLEQRRTLDFIAEKLQIPWPGS